MLLFHLKLGSDAGSHGVLTTANTCSPTSDLLEHAMAVKPRVTFRDKSQFHKSISLRARAEETFGRGQIM